MRTTERQEHIQRLFTTDQDLIVLHGAAVKELMRLSDPLPKSESFIFTIQGLEVRSVAMTVAGFTKSVFMCVFRNKAGHVEALQCASFANGVPCPLSEAFILRGLGIEAP